ncbi:MAG: PKD domain-containing protein [Bacteroidia bacterium]|nr:PKD domain-containing protein [Bacteroidia bacterium]
MKNLFMLVMVALLSGMASHVQAQTPNASVSGTILDLQGNPVANKEVFIGYYDIPNFSWTSIRDTTDNSGFYQGNLTLNTGTQYVAHVWFQNCQGNTQGDSVFLMALSHETINFVDCGSTPPSCDANFGFQLNGNGGFDFFNTSFVFSNSIAISWDFGDGSMATGTQVSHTFATNDTFQVCMTLVDSSQNCTDTQCYLVINNQMPPNPCQANFTISPRLGQRYAYIFNNISMAPQDSVTYIMEYGDGGHPDTVITPLPTNPNFTRAYNSAGYFQVCLTVISRTGCMDTYCDSLYNAGPSCSSSFASIPDGMGGYTFNPGYFGDPPVSYFWDFGDGSSSQQITPFHIFANGNYTVTLITETAAGCRDTVSNQILVNIRQPGDATIFGLSYVSDTTTWVRNGTAFLIQADTVNGQISLNLVDSVNITACVFQFNNVMPGNYYVKVALKPGSPYYATNLPTYQRIATYWSNADITTVNLLDEVALVILQAGVNPGGPGFVGGLVSQGANKQQGEGLGGIQVNLYLQDGTPVSYTYTDSDGAYAFDQLAYDDYRIHVEIPGLTAEDIDISLTAQNPRWEGNDFEVNTNEVSIATSLYPSFIQKDLSIFPNPAKDYLEIEFASSKSAELRFRILDVIGRTYIQRQENSIAGENRFKLDVGQLDPGIYLLEIQSRGETVTTKFCKRR